MNNKKTISIWLCVNRNGTACTFNSEPIRDNASGKWISKFPFINSAIKKEFDDLAQKAYMTWESEPELLEINI